MNNTRNCLNVVVASLLFATASGIPAVAQSSKSIPHPAMRAAIQRDSDEAIRNRQAKCCLQANTGQPGWTLVSAPPGIPTPQAPTILAPPNPGYEPAFPGSDWVGPTANSGVSSLPGGDYVYEFKFCLCEGQHPVVSLSFFSDNGSTVTLNGGVILPLTSLVSFRQPPGPFSVVYAGPRAPGDPQFLPCPQVNKLDIIVQNQAFTPTGLDAILNISGATVSKNGERCHCHNTDEDRDRDDR